jgi:hypothetical protein
MAYRKSSPEWILFLHFLDKTGYKAEYIRILLKNNTAKQVTRLRTDANPRRYVRYALPDIITLQEFLYCNRINQRWYSHRCGKS